MIRLNIPSIEDDDLQAVQRTLATGYLVQGPGVRAFEQSVASYVGTQYAVAVSSCTAALHISLLSLDIGPGDLVIVTAYSWLSTANVIELCGAQPVFVDIRPDTFAIDPDCLEATMKRLMSATDTAHRVKAILPVHTFGQIANMPPILKLAQDYNLPVIEDAACALGATLHGCQAGNWGVSGCFSFHPRKAITTGEGGIITTNDAALARSLRALRNHGQDPDSPTPDFIMPGFNYRMTEFQAALGSVQLTKLNRIIDARRQRAAHYDTLIEGTPLERPLTYDGSQPVYQSYVVLLPESISSTRQALIKRLMEQGIKTTIGTWHMPMATYFRNRYGYRPGDFPVTDQIFARSLTLPLSENMPFEDQKTVINCILSTIHHP